MSRAVDSGGDGPGERHRARMDPQVLTWAQLVRRAGSPAKARAWLGCGTWRRVLRGAYAPASLPDSTDVRVQSLRLVLPAPGDAVGLPGPGPFTTAALTASEGVLALRADGTGTGLVPSLEHHGSPFDGTVTTVTWTAYDVVVPGPDPGPFLHDAEHDLRRGVVECVSALRDLDVARWRPEVAEALTALRRQARGGIDEDELPGGYPQRARQLLVQARQLAGVLQLAGQDTGGAVDTREASGRERALRELGRLVRRARVAGYNAYGLPL